MTHFSESVACVNCMIEVVREQVFMLMLLSKTFAPTHIETEKQINGINNKFQRQTLKPINDICLSSETNIINLQYFSTNQFELQIHNDSDVISLNVFLLSDISLQFKLSRIKKTTLTASCKFL